jgi:hypothetical protein
LNLAALEYDVHTNREKNMDKIDAVTKSM